MGLAFSPHESNNCLLERKIDYAVYKSFALMRVFFIKNRYLRAIEGYNFHATHNRFSPHWRYIIGTPVYWNLGLTLWYLHRVIIP